MGNFYLTAAFIVLGLFAINVFGDLARYDERQILRQLQGMKWAFFSLFSFMLLYVVNHDWLATMIKGTNFIILALALSIIIWRSLAIWFDAYYTAHQPLRLFTALFLLLAWGFIGFYRLKNYQPLTSDSLETANLGLALVFFTQGSLTLIKWLRSHFSKENEENRG